MKKIGFVTNINRDTDMSVTHDLMAYVRSLNCETVELPDGIPSDVYLDFIIVLGGDGTMLRAARYAGFHDIPLLGINLGNIGYLTDVEKSQAKNSIQRVLSDEFKIEKRMMLEVQMCKNDAHLALNDIAIYRGGCSRMIECEVLINGEYMDTFRADGLIISTPTGSTAYNLAAGGPVLKPDAQMVVITPISPQSLSARPAVVSGDDDIRIRLKYSPQIDLELVAISIDGERVKIPKADDLVGGELEISISQSKHFTNIIKTTSFGFYEILRMKLHKE